jgi:hypothetical protein
MAWPDVPVVHGKAPVYAARGIWRAALSER